MEQTELKITLEKDVLELKRQYKYALENLERTKSDTNDVLAVKERVTKEINERNEELTKVLNDISNEKLTWALKKQSEIEEIEQKNLKAEQILKKESDLAIKEIELKKIKEETVDIRNEARRIELANKGEALKFDERDRDIVTAQKQLEADKDSFTTEKQLVKNSVSKLLAKITLL